MIVRVLSCGVHWWGMHSGPLGDPFRFRRKAAYFNSTGLMSGRRRRDCHIYPGRIRFNRTSGFDPTAVDRICGRTFQVSGPTLHAGQIHLLFELPAIGRTPDAYLVTLHSTTHGAIEFREPQWHAPGVQPIAISSSRERYEAMVLIRAGQWLETSLGRWVLSPDGEDIVLQEGELTHAV